MEGTAPAMVPAEPAEPAGRPCPPHVVALLLVALVPLAHLLAIAMQWFYFDFETAEELVRAGGLRGPYRAAILRDTVVAAVFLGAVVAAVGFALRQRGIPWARALGQGALHLFPLFLAPFLLFTDSFLTRVQLFAALVALVAAGIAFRILPAGPGGDRPSRWPRRLAPVAAVVFFAWYAALAWLQHASYWSSLYDLGLFAGSLRSTIHGDGFLFSPQFGCTFLAEHFSPILVLLTPLYWAWEDPLCLQVLQSLSMALAGYLVFLVAEETLKDGWLALAFSLSFLLAPDTFQAQWHGFKMDLLEPPLIVGALLALRRENVRWFLFCIVLMWATKEDTVIRTTLLGLYAGVAHKRWRLAIGVVAASVLLGVLLFKWVIPAYSIFQEPGAYFREFPGERYKFARHFAHLGPNLLAAMVGALSNPVYVVGWVLSEDRLASVLTLVAPLAFLACGGGWRTLLLLVPSLEMILANFDYMNKLDFYYSCAPMALAYPAAIFGLGRVLERLRASARFGDPAFLRRVRAAAGGWVVAAALVLLWYDTDSPASPANERPAYLVTPRTRLLDEVVASIPPEVPVSATGYAAIHLMNRPRPAMVPFGVDAAEYVLIDLFRPAFPVKLPAMLFFVRRLLDQPEWGVVRAERGVILLRRGAPRTGNARALAALDEPDIEAEDSEQSAYPNLAVRSGDASNGACLLVTPADRRGAGDLLFGPSYLLTPGGYEARFRLAAWRESYEPRERPAATIDVVREGRPLAARELRFRDFARPGAFEEFVLRFRVDVTVPVDFHVVYHDAGSLALDVIRIRKVEP